MNAHINRTKVVQGHNEYVLGQLPIQKVRWENIEAYYSEYRYVWDGDVGLFALWMPRLSERTLLHHHRFLSKALRDAVKKGVINRNPVDSAEAPSPKKHTVEAFPQEDNAQLIQMFEGQWRTMVMLIVATGVRRSEACGLKWDMVDFDTSEIEIRTVLVKAGRRLVLKGPKTKSSARRVSLPPALVAHLRTHKAEQAKQKLSAGEAYDDQGFVFAREDGRPINLDVFSGTFRSTVKGTRFEKFHVHGIPPQPRQPAHQGGH